MAVDRRKEMRDALLHKTQESHERRDDSGMYGDIFKEIEGLQKWVCKGGTHIIDIIPYQAGGNDPNTKEGDWTYLLDLWVHRGVGVNQDTYVCLARNFKLPCPICEYREKLREEADYDEDLVKSLYPKRRSIYNILCYDNSKEEAKGVQIWDVAHFFMEKNLMSIAKIPARGQSKGGFVAFADPDDGRSIQFERQGEGKDNTKFLGHQFLPRDGYKIEDAVLEQAFQIDQIVNIPTYEELSSAFFVEEGAPETQGEVTTGEGAEAGVAEEGAPTPASRIGRGAQASEAEVKKEPPTRTGRTITKVRVEGECPYGGTFGVDLDGLEECKNCDVWDDCSTKKDELNAKEAGEKKKTATPTSQGRGARRATAQAPKAPAIISRRGQLGKK